MRCVNRLHDTALAEALPVAPGKEAAMRSQRFGFKKSRRFATRLAMMLTTALTAAPAHAERLETYPEFYKSLPAAKVNNVWYVRNSSDTVVIFVHGVFSDSRSAWLYVDKDPSKHAYWPQLVVSDQNFRAPSVYLAGFYTSLDSGSYDMRKAAMEIVDALKRDAVLERKNLILVGHSTGGIMARYLLVHHRELFKDKKVGVVL